jgi:hypothetical protein
MDSQLRPKGVHIVVCEGEDDLEFLQKCWENREHASEIFIFYSGGRDSVATTTTLLKSSKDEEDHDFRNTIYVVDRDFKNTVTRAENSLTDKHMFTCWVCRDIEGYLLHPDWMLEALNIIQAAQPYPIRHFPTNEAEIEDAIMQVAADLVPDHAGRETMEALNELIGRLPHDKFWFQPDRELIRGGATFSGAAEWENMLLERGEKILENVSDLSQLSDLKAPQIRLLYAEKQSTYKEYTELIATIRQEFSGKRIFQILAPQWRVKSSKQPSKKAPWQILRDETMSVAIRYSQLINGNLSDDERLSDMGKLASKATGRTI